MAVHWSTDPDERAAGGLMILAGVVHGTLVRQHLKEWWGYGLFFVIAGLLQLLLALALLTDAVNEKDTGPRWRQVKLWMYGLGVLGNVALIALYVVSRTTGIPLFGPQAGTVESVGAVDVVTKVIELLAVALLVRLYVRQHRLLREVYASPA